MVIDDQTSVSNHNDARITENPVWLAQIIIRTVREEDLPGLEWDGELTHFRRLYRQAFQNAINGKTLIWVAEFPGKGIIGQLFVQLKSANKELADGKSRVYMYGFRVRSGYRGSGVGSRLLQTVEAYLVRRKFRRVTLNVGKHNIQARRFYTRHGFRIVASEPGRWSYLDDRGVRRHVHEPSWRMEKHIIKLS